MDDDTLRRGRPTAHVAFGEGFAILAGDALLTHAFAALSQPRSGEGPGHERRQIRAVACLAEAAGAGGMVGGQVLDLNASGTGAKGAHLEVDADRALRNMHERKTGALSRFIDRGTTGIQFLLSFVAFNILPTLFEVLLVCGILWALFGIQYALVTAVTITIYVWLTFAITAWRTTFLRC